MASQKIVRCEVRPPGGSVSATPRFIPLEIFGLWEFLMTAKHGFEVTEPCASLWLDTEDTPEASYSEDQYERVTEVTLFAYSQRDDMFARVCRYFPSQECGRLESIFLSHYQSDPQHAKSHVRERQGIWMRREPVGVEAE